MCSIRKKMENIRQITHASSSVYLFIFLSPQFITFYIGLQVIPVRQTFNSPFLLIASFIWTSHLISFFPLFSSTDERDAIQKKTFTKWVNKHLKKVSRKDSHQHCKRCEIGERSFTLHCDDQMVHAEFFQFFLFIVSYAGIAQFCCCAECLLLWLVICKTYIYPLNEMIAEQLLMFTTKNLWMCFTCIHVAARSDNAKCYLLS